MNNDNKSIKFWRALLLYIIIQPIIDVSISYFLLQLNTTITPGLIIRNLALLIGLMYILFEEKKHIWYFATLAVFYGIHFVINWMYKEPFNHIQEISYFSKYIFFIVALIVIASIYKKTRFIDHDDILIAMMIVMALMSVVIITGLLTNTGIQSYGSSKLGQIGWFFSGTKISAAMAILFPDRKSVV